jgi:hypothetical protein
MLNGTGSSHWRIGLVQPPLTARRGNHAPRARRFNGGTHHLAKTLLQTVRIKRMVMDTPASLLQLRCKVAHGAENQDQFLLVVVGVPCLFGDLGHQNYDRDWGRPPPMP